MSFSGKISTQWISRPEIKESGYSNLHDWRIKLKAHQEAQYHREKVAEKFIKQEPTDELVKEMEEARRKAKAARVERREAEKGDFILAAREFKLEDFRSLNYKYNEERLKREKLEEENALLKKKLEVCMQPPDGRIEIRKEGHKRYKYTMYRYIGDTPHKVFSNAYDSKDCIQDFINAQREAAKSAEGIAEGVAKGIAEGIAEGVAKGIAEGIAKGIAEGGAKGIGGAN